MTYLDFGKNYSDSFETHLDFVSSKTLRSDSDIRPLEGCFRFCISDLGLPEHSFYYELDWGWGNDRKRVKQIVTRRFFTGSEGSGSRRC